MLTIVCWKWNPGTHPKKDLVFSAEHVNNLRASIERNTTICHRIVCVTDDHRGLHSSVEPINISRHFGQFSDWGGCYRRLKAFDLPTGLALFGPKFISIDLDVVVTGNLDSILGFKDDFRIWKDEHRRKTPYCGSLWGMNAGARQRVWDSFYDRPYMAVEMMRRLKYIGTDQAHISCCLYPKEKTWVREDGIYNFNTSVRKRAWIQVTESKNPVPVVKQVDGLLPPGAKLIFFNGKYDPSQLQLQKQYSWIGDNWNG